MSGFIRTRLAAPMQDCPAETNRQLLNDVNLVLPNANAPFRHPEGAQTQKELPLTNYSERLVSFIWDVADLLRGPYRPPEYRKVMLPMTVLRRLDCVLEPSKSKVLEEQRR
jgi:hypothetical protein